MAQARAEHTKAVDEIGKGDQHLGGLRAKRETAASMATRKTEIEEIFLQLFRRKTKLEATNTGLEEWKVKIAEAEQKVEAHSGESSCNCPGCGVMLKVVGKGIELFKGKTADLNKQAAAKLGLQKANDAYNLLLRTQANDLKAVAESEQAGRDLDAMAETAGEVVTDAMI